MVTTMILARPWPVLTISLIDGFDRQGDASPVLMMFSSFVGLHN